MTPAPSNGQSARRVRLLLVNPRFPESFWSFRWALQRVLRGKRALNPPLGLATLAALCPPQWQVRIVDENVEGVPLDPRADVVGVCGMGVQLPRQRELLAWYRARGCYVVAGGSYASLCPEALAGDADTVVAGEAEYQWPQFCRDFEAGRAQPLYRESGTVDLADSPVPRFDLLRLERYANVSLQFSRGCPYHCEFCDIIVMFGRRPRTKAPEQIGRELDRLRALGVHNVFFVDDNLIGHKERAKALLRYLAGYQRRHRWRFSFGTEASINMAGDPQLLALLHAANFAWVFVGIESPDEASLRETGKTQNMRGDLLESVRRIYAAGLEIFAGFIVGFDNDTVDTFERQRRFITAAGVQVAMVGLLTALPKTPLYRRLQAAGRLRAPGTRAGDDPEADNTRAGTNLVPLRMSYETMVYRYEQLWHELVRDGSIARRLRAKARWLRRPVYRGLYPWPEQVRILARLTWRGLLPGGPARWFHFAAGMLTSRPSFWPVLVSDWIAALALQDFVRRRFPRDPGRDRRIGRATLAFVRRRCAACLQRGTLDAGLETAGSATRLALTLRGAVDPALFGNCARRIERLLRRSSAAVSLRVDALAAGQQAELQRLLERLARYGDRVSVRVNAALAPVLAIDSSVFHLVLEPDGTPHGAAQGAGA